MYFESSVYFWFVLVCPCNSFLVSTILLTYVPIYYFVLEVLSLNWLLLRYICRLFKSVCISKRTVRIIFLNLFLITYMNEFKNSFSQFLINILSSPFLWESTRKPPFHAHIFTPIKLEWYLYLHISKTLIFILFFYLSCVILLIFVYYILEHQSRCRFGQTFDKSRRRKLKGL